MGAVGCWCVTFFSLLVVLVAEAVQSSPCMRKVGRNRRFGACWESFVPGGPPSRLRGEFCTGWAAEPGVLGEFCTGSGTACGIKFSLLGLLVAEAVKSSPCMRKVGRNRRFGARWESFVPGGPAKAACWESFVPGGPPSQACWESFVPGMVQRGRAG